MPYKDPERAKARVRALRADPAYAENSPALLRAAIAYLG